MQYVFSFNYVFNYLVIHGDIHQYIRIYNKLTYERIFNMQEKEWRELRERVDKFNQDFWYNNNTMFTNAKAEYEDKCKG